MAPKRNDPCPCGSGLKYKKCCLHNDINDNDIQASDEFLKTKALAYKAMSDQKWQEAISLFKSILDSAHDKLEIYQAIAACYDGEEDYLFAAEFYEKALKVAPESKQADLLYCIGVAKGSGRRIDESINAFENFLTLSRSEEKSNHVNGILRMLRQIQEGNLNENIFLIQIQLQRAFTDMEEDRYQEAADRLQKILSFDPNNPAILYNLAVAYTFLEKEDDALAIFRKCVDILPSYYKAWYNMGQISFVKKQDFSFALSCFDRVVLLAPDYVSGHHQRAAVLEKLGDEAQALKSWRRVAELDPQNKAAQDAIQRLESNSPE